MSPQHHTPENRFMANELMQAASTTLVPWTDYGLRTLETMVAWQQQMLDQWFRMLSSLSPPAAVTAERSDALEAPRAARAEAAASSQRPQAARGASAKPRRTPAAREHPQAGETPRRASAPRGKARGRRR
jgi:hypothetical protein